MTWEVPVSDRRLIAFAILSAVVLLAPSAFAQRKRPTPLLAGIGIREITPPEPGQFLAGLDNDRVATGVHDPLFARALVLRSGKTTVALCAVDLIGFLQPDVAKVRKLVKGVPADNVIISATHTHSGPDTIGLWGRTVFRTGVDKEYMKFLRPRIAEAINEAVGDLGPVAVRFAYAKSPPKTSVNIRAKGEIDDEISIMQLRRPEGPIVATLVNWACHPEVLWGDNHLISSDFAHYLRAGVEQAGGGKCLYFQGALGGMVTADNEGRHTFAEAERIGRAVARAALEALGQREWLANQPLKLKHARVKLGISNVKFKLAAATGVIPAMPVANSVTTDLYYLQIGRAKFLTCPGEALPAVGLAAKKLVHGRYKFFLGLANDELGYILPEDYFKNEKYKYEASMSVGPKAAAIVLDSLRQLTD